MDFAELNNMSQWPRQKAMYLVTTAENLGMDTDGYGMVGENPNSGNVYVWLEDYPFTLFIPINGDVKPSDVYVDWTNPEDGEEHETKLGTKSLDDLYEWVEQLETEAGIE